MIASPFPVAARVQNVRPEQVHPCRAGPEVNDDVAWLTVENKLGGSAHRSPFMEGAELGFIFDVSTVDPHFEMVSVLM